MVFLIRVKRAKFLLERDMFFVQDHVEKEFYAMRIRLMWFVNAFWSYLMTTVSTIFELTNEPILMQRFYRFYMQKRSRLNVILEKQTMWTRWRIFMRTICAALWTDAC